LHYAAINGTQYFYDIPEKVAEVNSIGTYNLLHGIMGACQAEPALKPLIVFASTSETYGEPFHVPTNEEDVTYARISEVRDSYAIAKLMSEFYVKLYAKKLGLEFLIFRIFNVYGPRMVGTRYGQVIPEFIVRLKEGEYPLNILGDGKHTRSFIYIDDHVSLAFAAVMKAKRDEVYNLGNPHETSIIELAELAMTKLGLEPAFKFLPERSGDHKRRVPSVDKLLKQIGSFNFTSLDSGLTKMIEHSS
jgi:nucleoside-diphosphate-sugar epimerase